MLSSIRCFFVINFLFLFVVIRYMDKQLQSMFSCPLNALCYLFLYVRFFICLIDKKTEEPVQIFNFLVSNPTSELLKLDQNGVFCYSVFGFLSIQFSVWHLFSWICPNFLSL